MKKQEKPIETWMIVNLRKYKNCLIGHKRLNQIGGEDQLISELKEQGLDCQIVEMEQSKVKKGNRSYIIKVKNA